MKAYFLILLCCLYGLPLLGQEPLSVSEVIQVEGVSKDDLFDRAKNWFAEEFRDANSVLQIDDKENGQLVGRAVMNYKPNVFMASDMFKGSIWYLVKISTKEGRYKYEITSFTHEASGGKYNTIHLGLLTAREDCPSNIKGQPRGTMNKFWRDTKTQSLVLSNSIAESIKNYMSKPTIPQDDNW